MKNSIILGFTGALSGIFSVIIAQYYRDISYTAGIVFGIFIGLYFLSFWRNTIHPSKIFLWICASVAGYYSAVSFVLSHRFSNNQAVFFVAGLLGAAIMLVGFHAFLTRLTLRQYIMLAALGGILGLAWFLGDTDADSGAFPPALVWLYVCWQTGMAFGLGYALDKNQKTI